MSSEKKKKHKKILQQNEISNGVLCYHQYSITYTNAISLGIVEPECPLALH